MKQTVCLTSAAVVKIRRYLDEDVVPRKHNLLDWWKKNQFAHLILSTIMNKYCHVIATSAPCERMFCNIRVIIETLCQTCNEQSSPAREPQCQWSNLKNHTGANLKTTSWLHPKNMSLSAHQAVFQYRKMRISFVKRVKRIKSDYN